MSGVKANVVTHTNKYSFLWVPHDKKNFSFQIIYQKVTQVT
jgi:hypothetical protein